MHVAMSDAPRARKMGRPKSKRNDVAVKVDAGLVDMARLISMVRKVTMAEYLTGLLRDAVERDYAEALDEAKKARRKSRRSLDPEV